MAVSTTIRVFRHMWVSSFMIASFRSPVAAAKRAGYAKTCRARAVKRYECRAPRSSVSSGCCPLALIVLSLAWAALRDLPLVARLVPTPSARRRRRRSPAPRSGRRSRCCCARPRCGACGTRGAAAVQPPRLATRDIVVIALLSGLTEELFFRGVLLPETGTRAVEPVLRRAARALHALFRCGRPPSAPAWVRSRSPTGSLVTPIVAHATYNLGALLLLRRAALRRDRRRAVDARVPTTIASPHGIG